MTAPEIDLIMQKLIQLETILVGISGSDNRGICGELKEIKLGVSNAVDQSRFLETRLIKLEEQHKEPQNSPVPAQPSTAKKVGLWSGIGLAISSFIYGLGCKLGWW
jgi:hypothetical protein